MVLNPQILMWARATAGLSIDEAAQALGFKDTRGRTASDRLRSMEVGKDEPSRSVLLKMTQVYHRSLLVFYLAEPPQSGDRGQDFRKAPGVKPPEYDPTLDALIRDVRGRQGIVKDLLEQAEPKRVDYVASATMETAPEDLAVKMTDRLGFSLSEFRKQANSPAAFAYLRTKVEASGAFVLLLGNLGSHHTDISSSIFRGYAIADPVAPFIVVNDKDAKVAWAFTTIHELAHVWLGATGLSDGTNNAQLESYCNRVASEVLLPDFELKELRFLRNASLDESVREIARFANKCKVSRAMVAYKLHYANIIGSARWRELDEHYRNEWSATQAQQATASKSDGGPSYYILKRHRLGHALLELVKSSLSDGFITYTKAGRILGVKPRNVDPLVYAAGMRGGHAYYPLDQVPEFWSWVHHQAAADNIKIPREIMEEIQAGRKDDDPLLDWMCIDEIESALTLEEVVDVALVQQVVSKGYAPDLRDDEIEKIGRDPFLIAYALVDPGNRVVVTTEVSRPSAQRANRKVPDVCSALGASSCGPFALNKALGFKTGWKT